MFELTFALNNMATRRKDVVGEGESSDSDEVPEDVSLSRGREEALKAHRVAAKESRRCGHLCEGREIERFYTFLQGSSYSKGA